MLPLFGLPKKELGRWECADINSSAGLAVTALVLVVVPGPACVCDELSRIWDRFRPVFLEIRLQIGSATSAGEPIRSLVIRMARLPSLSVRARALA